MHSKLEMQDGNAEQSGHLLVDIYHSFTQGFDTLVLHKAKRVLSQCQG